MGVCKDGDLRGRGSDQPTDDAELPVILDRLRQRWSFAAPQVSDRQIRAALRRVIEHRD